MAYADQPAMRVSKRVAIRTVRYASAEAVLVEVLDHGRVRQQVVAFERQQGNQLPRLLSA